MGRKLLILKEHTKSGAFCIKNEMTIKTISGADKKGAITHNLLLI